MPIKHLFVSAKADGDDDTLVQPSDWNDDHDIDITTADVPDSEDARYVTDAQLAVVTATSGTNTGDQNIFQTIAVSGQDNVVADSTTDTVTFASAGNLSITTNASTDTVTFTATEPLQSFIIACSDEVTAITAGNAKVKFRMPYAFTVTEVRASLSTAQTSGNIFTVDINEEGTSIISTKLTIDNTELTSVTAATPPVISDSALADDAEISIDVDQVGDGTAKGLKVAIIGRKA
jgi:hypothetical protein